MVGTPVNQVVHQSNGYKGVENTIPVAIAKLA